jgi:hypothetical protein
MKMIRRKMDFFQSRDDAVVGVVIAILLVGLVLAVIFIIETVYMPTWMAQREAEHMEEVADKFTLLKFAIDTQSANEQEVPISTSIPLGSKELPFLSSSRAFGFLKIEPDSFVVKISNSTSTSSYILGGIRYSSRNSYFLDQSFIYEAGGVITDQFEGNVIAIKPYFDVDKNTEVNISFYVVNVSVVGGKTSVSGYGTYPIQTKFLRSQINVTYDVQAVTLNTTYKDAWWLFINSTLKEAGLVNGTDFWLTETSNGLIINFSAPLIVNVELKISHIEAQIAPGWVE